MTDELQQLADGRLAAALAATGARDPRDFYRSRLRELKRTNSEAYREATKHYRNKLIPSVAEDGEDPIQAWQAYGLLLADLTAPGNPVAVDASGRSRPFEPPGEPTDVVLHVPHAKGRHLVLVGLPPEPSRAQVATYHWMVLGRRSAPNR